jgi:hypothetical protein
MSSPTRRANRAHDKRGLLGTCSKPKCKRNAFSKFSCKTCEALLDEGRLCAGNVVEYLFCSSHQDWAVERIKRHTMIGHPANVMRAIAAGLRGEEI